MINFIPHRAVWTRENSARFRDELFSLTGGDGSYFHSGMTDPLFRFARAHGANVDGEILGLGWSSDGAAGAHIMRTPPSTLTADTYSSIFVVDLIEHLADDELGELVAELYQALRAGGSLVVVAPNEEKLQIGQTVCPDCGTMFHRAQHVRSWSLGSLAAYMSECGFETVTTTPWYLDEHWWRSRLITTAARALRKRLPHLVYIGRKPLAR